MSISIDPLSLIKDYIGNRREKKDLEKLLNKHYRIQTVQETMVGKFVNFQKIGPNYMLSIEINGDQSRISFDKINMMQEIRKEEYEFPRKLDELISLSTHRAERRPSYLSWIIDSSKLLKASAIKWFDFEMAQVERQIEILILLFSHRKEYQDWKEKAAQISLDFKKAIQELDKIIMLVEKKEVERMEDIYEKDAELLPITAETEKKPNMLKAFMGLFSAGRDLESLVANVESAISNIQDTVTIAKIQLSRDGI